MTKYVYSMIKIVYQLQIYRHHILQTLKNDDVVVELGCHLGNTTRLIAEKCPDGRIIAIDNSPEAIIPMENLIKEYPNIEFISGDVRLHKTLEKVLKTLKKCDILTVDLGGGYHPDTTFKVYFIWSSSLKPAISIIRNQGLLDFVSSSHSEEYIKSKNGWLESSADAGIPPHLKEFKLWSSKL